MLYCETKTTKRGGARLPYGIGVMNADGTGRRLVDKTATTAVWSADGRYFACQREPNLYSEEGPVTIYDRSGKLVRKIAYTNGLPAWSGDGQYLAYTGKAGKLYLASRGWQRSEGGGRAG